MPETGSLRSQKMSCSLEFREVDFESRCQARKSKSQESCADKRRLNGTGARTIECDGSRKIPDRR